MKKLKLRLQDIEGAEVLTREQLKRVLGGNGSGSGSGAGPVYDCVYDNDCMIDHNVWQCVYDGTRPNGVCKIKTQTYHCGTNPGYFEVYCAVDTDCCWEGFPGSMQFRCC